MSSFGNEAFVTTERWRQPQVPIFVYFRAEPTNRQLGSVNATISAGDQFAMFEAANLGSRFARNKASPKPALKSVQAAQAMKIVTLSIPIILPVVLAIETAFFAALAAAILDFFVRRPQVGGGSITTLLPGFVYASATVMKVCLVSALISAVVGLVWRLFMRSPAKQSSASLPVWGIASITLTPSTLLLGALAVLGTQSLVDDGGVISASHFSQIARNAVFVMLAILSAAVLAAAVSLIRRERPHILPIHGLLANMVLMGLFWYFRFYALGFDQDLWAPR